MRLVWGLASLGDISRACAIADCETQSQNHIFADCAFGVRHFRIWDPPIDGRPPRQTHWRPTDFKSGYKSLIPSRRPISLILQRDANWPQLLLSRRRTQTFSPQQPTQTQAEN